MLRCTWIQIDPGKLLHKIDWEAGEKFRIIKSLKKTKLGVA